VNMDVLKSTICIEHLGYYMTDHGNNERPTTNHSNQYVKIG
jgi:hypothetical protein